MRSDMREVPTTLDERILRKGNCSYETCRELGIETTTWKVVSGNAARHGNQYQPQIPVTLVRLRCLEVPLDDASEIGRPA